jgi:hypothetical protein
MINFLKLLGGSLVGLRRSRAARKVEMAFPSTNSNLKSPAPAFYNIKCVGRPREDGVGQREVRVFVDQLRGEGEGRRFYEHPSREGLNRLGEFASRAAKVWLV